MEDSERVSGNIGSILSTRVLNSSEARCLYYKEKIDGREKVVVSLDKRLYTPLDILNADQKVGVHECT